MPSIRIKAIHFHEGDSSVVYTRPGMGQHSIPQGRFSAAVELEIVEKNGDYITLTEILRQHRFDDYNQIVDLAYRQLADRLVGFA